MLKVAKRADVEPFRVMEVLKAAFAKEEAEGPGSVCHLEVGEPGGRAPEPVLKRAQEHLLSKGIGYTNTLGVPALRQAIVQHYQRQYGLTVPYERVVVTAGSSAGFVLSFLAAFEPGDRVALVEPAYPAYRNILKALDLEPVLIPGRPEDRFLPTPKLLTPYADKLDGLMVAHPNNPTGAIMSRSELDDLSAFCRTFGIRLISDEIYHGITYGTTAETALACAEAEDIFVINSFSKYFVMTGWRLGWMIVPGDLVDPIERLAQNLFISAPGLSQYAAVAAFDAYEEMDARVASYQRNRDALMAALPALGFRDIVAPDGAFYIYGNIEALSDNSIDLAQTLLAETGVALTAGVDFDTREGRKWMRLSYCANEETIQEAIKRLQEWSAHR